MNPQAGRQPLLLLPLSPMSRAGGAPEWCRQAGPAHQRAVLPTGHHSPFQRSALPLQLLPYSRESHWWGEHRLEKYSSCAAAPSTSPSARFSHTPLSGASLSCSYTDSTCQPGVTGGSSWSGMPHHFWLHPHLKVQHFRYEMCFTSLWPLPVFFLPALMWQQFLLILCYQHKP